MLFAVFLCFGHFLTYPALARGKKMPHYFEEIARQNSMEEQLEAYARYLASSDCIGGSRQESYIQYHHPDKIMTVSRTIEGKKVTFFFHPWIKEGNKIIFYDYCGQKEITPEQFEVVAEDFIAAAVEAMNIKHEYYKNFEKWAIEGKAEALGKSEAEVREQLDKPMPDAPTVTFREANKLPKKVEKSQSIPSEVHFAYQSEVLGRAWLNSDIVYTTLQARIIDYMTGKPRVMVHEFIHADPNLTSLPLSEGFDVELLASIPALLLPEDKLSLPFHKYLQDVREWAWVFFGLNFDQIRKEVFLFRYHDVYKIDVAKLREYAPKIERAATELRERFFPKAIKAFYADQIFWTSLNQKLVDDAGMFRIMMAMEYEPTILGGYAETKKFLDAKHSEIMDMAHRAFMESGKPRDDEEGEHYFGISMATIKRFQKEFNVSNEEVLRIAKKYRLTEEMFKGKEPSEIILLLLDILEKERGGNAEKEVIQ